MDEFEAQYEQNGIIYKIIGNEELHYNLQHDSIFAVNYIEENQNSLEIAGVLRDDAGPSQGGSTSKENVPPSDTVAWSRANTLLLIENYKDQKDKFRNPKFKNKDLWCNIVGKFCKKGIVVTADQLDRKFRNLKKTYKTINDNKKKNKDWTWTCTVGILRPPTGHICG